MPSEKLILKQNNNSKPVGEKKPEQTSNREELALGFKSIVLRAIAKLESQQKEKHVLDEMMQELIIEFGDLETAKKFVAKAYELADDTREKPLFEKYRDAISRSFAVAGAGHFVMKPETGHRQIKAPMNEAERRIEFIENIKQAFKGFSQRIFAFDDHMKVTNLHNLVIDKVVEAEEAKIENYFSDKNDPTYIGLKKSIANWKEKNRYDKAKQYLARHEKKE